MPAQAGPFGLIAFLSPASEPKSNKESKARQSKAFVRARILPVDSLTERREAGESAKGDQIQEIKNERNDPWQWWPARGASPREKNLISVDLLVAKREER